MQEREMLLRFINKVNRTKYGSKGQVVADDPRFRLLDPIVTEEMAEVAMGMEFRVHRTVSEIAEIVGKDEQRTGELLWELAMAGVCFVTKENDVDTYWHDTWVPGIFEMVVNNRENVKKYPQIGMAFEEYGRLRGPMSPGIFPVGKGIMRVIPIESAIDGSTHTADHEEISHHLESAEIFSVSDCSCRTSRETVGEGCHHLKEDMCIQLDHAAEYYIRTGRGREITREEAYDIIARAEADGLMHSIPNADGDGKTHAICNCCGCSCYAVRNATMYNNPNMMKSNFIARVEKDNCVGCGECVEVCPTGAIKLGQKLCTKEEVVDLVKRTDFPHNTEWKEDKWNVEYRENRELSFDSGTAPCKTDCPAHISIPGYIKLASQGRYTEALKMIKAENPLPAVCGRICPALCEDACTRTDLDDPVAIDDIKKFIAEQDLNLDVRYIPEIKHDYDKHIAVIGAGPAGLSCAYYLAEEGYKVTVYERETKLGGMLTLGIPNFRLEKEVIEAEIDVLRQMGVTFETGVEVGKDVTIPELRENGFKAFFIAIGAQNGKALGIEGEDSVNVTSGVTFLKDVALGNAKDLMGTTVVIGGGNVAIDVARTAVRLGSSSTQMFCLESREEMPALPEEVMEALEENIEINNGWGPSKFVVEDGKVTAVEFQKCISVMKDGKFNPEYSDERKVVEVDNVLTAIGQAIDWGNLLSEDIEINPNGTIKVDSFTLQSSIEDIFAGGDVVTGPKYAIDAIALGKEGYKSIHRFVNEGHSLTLGRIKREYEALDKANVDFRGYDKQPRQHTTHAHIQNLKGSFVDNRGLFTEEQVKAETERCLGCGITVVDEFMCIGCGACTTRCKFDAIKLHKEYDEVGVHFDQIKPIVVKEVVKRKARIAVKKVLGTFGAK